MNTITSMATNQTVIESLNIITDLIKNQSQILEKILKSNTEINWIHHIIDFFVILLADLGAAIIVFMFLERKKEEETRKLDAQKDKEERSFENFSKISTALGSNIEGIYQILERVINTIEKTPNTPVSLNLSECLAYENIVKSEELSKNSIYWNYSDSVVLKELITEFINQCQKLPRKLTESNFEKLKTLRDLCIQIEKTIQKYNKQYF